VLFLFSNFFFNPSKSHYLIRPVGTFSKEKEIGILSFWGRLKIRDWLNSRVRLDSFQAFLCQNVKVLNKTVYYSYNLNYIKLKINVSFPKENPSGFIEKIPGFI